MRIAAMMMVVGAAGLLGACEMRVGDRADEGRADEGNVTASLERAGTNGGEAEEGRFSLKAPGVDISLNIPDAIRSRANIGNGDDMVPPGVALSGLHVDGLGGADGRNSVELRFTSAEAPAAIARWYQNAQERGRFALSGTRREGEGIVLTGTRARDGDPFTVRLAPRDGGTEGRIVLAGGAH